MTDASPSPASGEARAIARDLVDAWMPLWVQRALQMEEACNDLVRLISIRSPGLAPRCWSRNVLGGIQSESS